MPGVLHWKALPSTVSAASRSGSPWGSGTQRIEIANFVFIKKGGSAADPLDGDLAWFWGDLHVPNHIGSNRLLTRLLPLQRTRAGKSCTKPQGRMQGRMAVRWR